MSISVAVAGASGYAGGELLRLLSSHPQLEVRTVTAHSNAGQRLGDIHPHLHRLGDLVLADTSAENLAGHDVVFVALPHGKSGELTDRLPDNVVVVDAGADHRLIDEDDWNRFYGGDYHGAWTYGLPELLREGGRQRDWLRGATRIAAPGCNVSAISIGLAPAVAAGLVETDDLVAVLAVGPSGAGRSLKPNLLASEILGSASAYAVGGTHRHIPEIQQDLRWAASAPGEISTQDIHISFTPVLVPMARGILATSTARLSAGTTIGDLRDAYEAAYEDERFVELLPAGRFPATASVLGSNVASLGIAVDEAAGRLVAVSALDNLVKGTAGAAIQSANIALGLDEAAGLPIEGVAP
ncbi:N-acetyl-gamma-glutamyl-phosphate reductase [Pseudoclavibacter sp. CFCC 13796]|uniref:N-acetyl-gamma-glutamyl-phosphate reductase n=1 Tax=Pseudoclavibacter sp. CFCC 13796 TaxID=2615179 RepID=UPI0013010E2F|nr:N-acetyl-gamma-glutamyl-phosphate reductase [Pseudoclavibacter sp. CFCC 13796]KAB1659733.1 N-acetyl-gamma-glutamyl-phosphate reductase [Pseudoclavibacter sp. CFCC 13796]